MRHLLTVERATLINYVLNFTNYTYNPLTISMAGVYNAKKWSRATTAHGQTLLSLAFNYGVLSMMTLTLGTAKLDIELQDRPAGCFGAANDTEKVSYSAVALGWTGWAKSRGPQVQRPPSLRTVRQERNSSDSK